MKRNSKRIVTLSAPIEASDYLTKETVAKRLGVSPKTVGEWANLGKLPAYRIGPYLRFKWAEIEAHLAATCQVKRGAWSAERGIQNGEFRHLTPYPVASQARLQMVAQSNQVPPRGMRSPIEAERERKTRI